ncbi:hypothetical protein [Treponema lecithinolyticum]
MYTSIKKDRVKKVICVCLLCVCICTGKKLFAQGNISVPLEDPVYNLLEYALIRGYCSPLHNARPYTLNTVLHSLDQIVNSSDAGIKEKITARDTIERLKGASPTIFDKNKTAAKNAAVLFKTGSYVYENNTKVPIRLEIGASWQSDFNFNFNEPNISTIHWFDMYIRGDITKYFSYNVNAGMGIMKIDTAGIASVGAQTGSHAPFTFTQSWDGYQYRLKKLSEFDGLSNDPAAGIRLLPEFGVHFWDGKAGISFSRVRRDWGTGNGNLMLSKTARPFTAIDMYLRPVEWLNLSVLTGSLEFFRSTGIKESAATFQNNISALMAEIFIKDIAYIGFNSSSVWAKRFEPGYLNPGMIPFFYQNMVGDFDNLQLGFSLGFNVPKYAKIYYNLFIDEADLGASDFFHQAGASMCAWQAGAKIAIPDTPFMSFVLQYTKLEPYVYTHPLEEIPGYTGKMNTSYLNHGEPIGYKLKPNSDEIKIGLYAFPTWFASAHAFYSMVHHGADYGSGIVHGSSFGDLMVYGQGASSAKPGDYYYKDFLKDGVYEWIHSIGANTEVDMRFVKNIPLKLKLGYTLSYTHHTEFTNGVFKQARSDEYVNRFGNYLSLSIKVY